MEGVEFVGQSRHETVIVIDHAKEVLKADQGGGNKEVIYCLDPGLEGNDARVSDLVSEIR